MKSVRINDLRAALFVGIWLLATPVASACGVCFGKSDSAMAKGMNMGIVSLLVMVAMMLTIVASFFVFLSRQAGKASRDGAGGGARE